MLDFLAGFYSNQQVVWLKIIKIKKPRGQLSIQNYSTDFVFRLFLFSEIKLCEKQSRAYGSKCILLRSRFGKLKNDTNRLLLIRVLGVNIFHVNTIAPGSQLSEISRKWSRLNRSWSPLTQAVSFESWFPHPPDRYHVPQSQDHEGLSTLCPLGKGS